MEGEIEEEGEDEGEDDEEGDRVRWGEMRKVRNYLFE